MKKKFYFQALLLLAGIISTACSSDDKPAPYIRIMPEKLDVPAGGGDFVLAVEYSAGIEWDYRFEEENNWITETERDENSVTFAVAENLKSIRTAEIVFIEKDGDIQTRLPAEQAGDPFYVAKDDPEAHGYTLMKTMRADASLVDQDWESVDTYMKKYQLEYTEHPNRNTGSHHFDGKHIEVVYDETLGQYVYNFMVHVETDICGDGTTLKDRQRNEMKSRVHSTNKTAYKDVNGNYGEWQIIEWKMKIPKGFRASTSFTHIHQLKGQEGSNISSPVITLTLRRNGENSRVQVIHNGRGSATHKGTFIDNIPLSDFEDEWVQIQEESHFVRNGFYRIKITRLSDGKVLVDHSENDIDMWRTGGAVNIRNKFGIYRSFGKTLSGPDDRPVNGIKDENLWLGDFRIYEKNSNPDPQPNND